MPEKNYESYSYWLSDAGEALTPRSPLLRSEEVDVAILGGGYSGLWTAYYLLRALPDLKVAVLEQEIVGYGGSGRNGGWCSPRFPVSAGMLHKRYGPSTARSMLLAVQDSIEEIRRVCEREKIDARFRAGGTLTLARSESQLSAIQESYSAYVRLGLGGRYQMLSADQTHDRIRATRVRGALYTPDGASLHPARLVRGLARAVEALGGTIYEQTAVTEFHGGRNARLVTLSGEVSAAKAIVLAGEAYLTRFPQLHRSLLPVYSLICLTKPLTEEHWKQIGWAQGENVASTRQSVVYLTRTDDGRILFGSRGAPYVFGSKISDAQDRDAATIRAIEGYLLDWFPSLAGVRFTHAWGGPVAMPTDWMPSVRFDAQNKLAFLGGYTGQGVSTSNLSGRLLAGLIAGIPTSLESLPLAQRRSRDWIPEPLRWMTVRYMQQALLRCDEASEAGRRRPLDGPLAEFLARH